MGAATLVPDLGACSPQGQACHINTIGAALRLQGSTSNHSSGCNLWCTACCHVQQLLTAVVLPALLPFLALLLCQLHHLELIELLDFLGQCLKPPSLGSISRFSLSLRVSSNVACNSQPVRPGAMHVWLVGCDQALSVWIAFLCGGAMTPNQRVLCTQTVPAAVA